MSRTRYYTFKYSDGSVHSHSPREALAHCRINGLKIAKNGYLDHVNSPRRTVKDGFQPGYQVGLGQYAGGPREYQKKCREAGLVEMGKEYKAPVTHKDDNLWTEDLAKDLASYGMSESEIDTLKD